jgi:hypothetical protein
MKQERAKSFHENHSLPSSGTPYFLEAAILDYSAVTELRYILTFFTVFYRRKRGCRKRPEVRKFLGGPGKKENFLLFFTRSELGWRQNPSLSPSARRLLLLLYTPTDGDGGKFAGAESPPGAISDLLSMLLRQGERERERERERGKERERETESKRERDGESWEREREMEREREKEGKRARERAREGESASNDELLEQARRKRKV